VRKAVIGNPEVQASWHAFTASAEEQEVARGGYRPSVDVVGVVGREHLRDNGQNSTFSQRDATLRLSQMVYDGFATRSEVARLGYVKLARARRCGGSRRGCHCARVAGVERPAGSASADS
jgi:adhesin transport system outer membrane protein